MDMKPVSRNMPVRMDLRFVGLATFAGQPACTDWDKLDGADVAVLGIPIDTASSYRVGTGFGPRAIREVSMFHGFGPEGVFDLEDEVTYLTAEQDRRCRRQRRHLRRYQAQSSKCRARGARPARRQDHAVHPRR
jgi:arginase family enzyme